LTTNGTLLRPRYLEPVAPYLDLLAISLDGIPASHGVMRGAANAFEHLDRGLSEVHRSGLPFGFIFTLTQYNVNELRWVADYACRNGARLLQIHPLEAVGRARDGLPTSRPDKTERFYAMTEALEIQARVGDRLHVQLDLASVHALEATQQSARAGLPAEALDRIPLADLCAPLVLEPDGVLVPLTYGFPRDHAIGDLARENLATAAPRWKRRYGEFVSHCKETFRRAESEGGLVNWFELLSTDRKN
jgi:hypothetical protein